MFPRRPPIAPGKPLLAPTCPRPSNAPTSRRRPHHPRSQRNRTVWPRKSIRRRHRNRCSRKSAFRDRRRPRMSFTHPRRRRSPGGRCRPRRVRPDRPSSPTFPIRRRLIRRNLRGGALWSTANKCVGNQTRRPARSIFVPLVLSSVARSTRLHLDCAASRVGPFVQPPRRSSRWSEPCVVAGGAKNPCRQTHFTFAISRNAINAGVARVASPRRT
jgi:hypothetical protein